MAELDKLVDDLDQLAVDVAKQMPAGPVGLAIALDNALEGARDNSEERLVAWALVAQKLT